MNIPDLACATEKRDAAYEIKFLVPASVADAALSWARLHLAPDPHADSPSGDGYRVNSLYFDTSKLDVYQRNGSYGKSKYRIRRYGAAPAVFLERKLKSRGLVSKRRTRVPDAELRRLAGMELAADWVGFWFGRRLSARQLQPQCQICYERVARVGMSVEGPVRLTVDRDVRAFRSKEFEVAELGDWVPLLPGRCILELKFRQDMPALFKALTDELQLQPQPVSKYRLTVQAFGLDPAAKGGDATHQNGHVTNGALLHEFVSARAEMRAPPREA